MPYNFLNLLNVEQLTKDKADSSPWTPTFLEYFVTWSKNGIIQKQIHSLYLSNRCKKRHSLKDLNHRQRPRAIIRLSHTIKYVTGWNTALHVPPAIAWDSARLIYALKTNKQTVNRFGVDYLDVDTEGNLKTWHCLHNFAAAMKLGGSNNDINDNNNSDSDALTEFAQNKTAMACLSLFLMPYDPHGFHLGITYHLPLCKNDVSEQPGWDNPN